MKCDAPWTRIRMRRDRRAWLARRAAEHVGDELVAEADVFLASQDPVDLGHWRTVEMGIPGRERRR
jgi:hypothetical protein